MMPILLDLHSVWHRLNEMQREQHARPRAEGVGFSRTVGVRRPTLGYHDPSARVWRVRMALETSKDKACGMLVERLSGINLSTVLGVFIAACSDVAVVWGGSVLAGGALGGVVGAFAGGVGAVPGAALGAGLGVQAGLWILGFLGLKSLIEDLGTAVPEVLRLYEQGFRTAWGKADDWGSLDRHDSFRTNIAANEFAQGHVLLMVTMLSALLAYLTRGRQGAHPAGDPREPAAGPQGGRLGGGQRRGAAEMDRQLGGQERGLNEMTVDEYLKGRNAFDPASRDPRIAKVARAEYEQDLTRKLKEQLIKKGVAPGEAAKQAVSQAAAKMGTLAALHNPDMVVAGKDIIADFGDRGINSRIGAQWRTRAGELDAAAKQVAHQDRAATKMNAKLERC